MVKFSGKVISVGPLVEEFINEGILVFFGSNAPSELVEFSIIHDCKEFLQPVEPGDEIQIDDSSFEILAVGPVANKNLENLGHFIIKFNGEYKIRLPGDINVEKKPVPKINEGSIIQIKKSD